MQNSSVSLLWILSIAVASASMTPRVGVAADGVTQCRPNSECYCVTDSLQPAIAKQIDYIRTRVREQRSAGKAIGYMSLPLSSIGGGYFGTNATVASQVKERVETRLGGSHVWILNPATKDYALPTGATGQDYMLMWSSVFEGDDDMGRLEDYYDLHAPIEPDLAKISKKDFRDYYALRAGVSASLGAHDEWNIAVQINRKRLADKAFGMGRQLGLFFDGRSVPLGEADALVAWGDAGPCKGAP